MTQGVILISVDEDKTNDYQNPWRTGGWVVVKSEAIERLSFNDEVKQELLKKRSGFVIDQIWDMFGLPRGQTTEERS